MDGRCGSRGMVGVRGVITGLGREGRRALASLAVGKARAGARAGWVGGSRGGIGLDAEVGCLESIGIWVARAEDSAYVGLARVG